MRPELKPEKKPESKPAASPEPRVSDPAAIAPALERWFETNRRPFPWRPARLATERDPWRALVSEIMLQQTQAARVAERFDAFIARFPSARAMVGAGVDAVLAEWSGLGYYRRARSLFACAQAITEHHAGQVPRTLEGLLSLPGVGPYTAGAVASIALGQRVPIADGNVARVTLRLAAHDAPQDDPAVRRWVWQQAQRLVDAAGTPALLNEALMELGATVCTPRTPACASCPVANACRSHADGRTGEIPRPKRPPRKRPLHCTTLLLIDARGRRLVEQRPGAGLWSGLWQAPTLESPDAPPEPGGLLDAMGRDADLAHLASFAHATTHRDVRFEVYAAELRGRAPRGRRWRSPAEIGRLALATPQRRILLELDPGAAGLFAPPPR
ncbi:MAG: A/G-specific adenine glycosylase [Planctomycetota bacterium]